MRNLIFSNKFAKKNQDPLLANMVLERPYQALLREQQSYQPILTNYLITLTVFAICSALSAVIESVRNWHREQCTDNIKTEFLAIGTLMSVVICAFNLLSFKNYMVYKKLEHSLGTSYSSDLAKSTEKILTKRLLLDLTRALPAELALLIMSFLANSSFNLKIPDLLFKPYSCYLKKCDWPKIQDIQQILNEVNKLRNNPPRLKLS